MNFSRPEINLFRDRVQKVTVNVAILCYNLPKFIHVYEFFCTFNFHTFPGFALLQTENKYGFIAQFSYFTGFAGFTLF